MLFSTSQGSTAGAQTSSRAGHKEIAFMKGSDVSPDSEDRWNATREAARGLGIRMRSDLMVQLEGEDATPQLGYPLARSCWRVNGHSPPCSLITTSRRSVRCLRSKRAGLRVPEDISVVGFDDIAIAVHNTPSLTTVRQPLQRMGELAARALLERIEHPEKSIPKIEIAPEFVVRSSTSRRLIA